MEVGALISQMRQKDADGFHFPKCLAASRGPRTSPDLSSSCCHWQVIPFPQIPQKNGWIKQSEITGKAPARANMLPFPFPARTLPTRKVGGWEASCHFPKPRQRCCHGHGARRWLLPPNWIRILRKFHLQVCDRGERNPWGQCPGWEPVWGMGSPARTLCPGCPQKELGLLALHPHHSSLRKRRRQRGEEEKKRSVTKSCDTHVNIACMNWVLHLLLAAAC